MSALIASGLSLASSAGAGLASVGGALGLSGAAAGTAGLTSLEAMTLGGVASSGAGSAGMFGLTAGQMFGAQLGISALGEGMNFFGQKQASSAAQKSARMQQEQDNMNVAQNEEAQSSDLFQKQIDVANARATARTSAGESGTTGNSVDALIGDYNAQEGRWRASQRTQAEWNRQQSRVRKLGYGAVAQREAPAPSPFASALRVGGGALDAYHMAYGKPNQS